MKIDFVITDGYKQVMFTPQNRHEKEALKMITPGDTLVGVTKWGTFDRERSHAHEAVAMCQGGYLRRFAEENALMFVIQDSKETPPTEA